MANEKFYAVVEFEDGLQVIPNNWLDISMMKAVWPNFTNNKRYYKAVKLMEEPESTWMEHSIRKVYGTYCKQCHIFSFSCIITFLYIMLIYMYFCTNTGK